MKISRLFVSDMDGTFLDTQGGYDRKRLEAVLDDFERAGYLFAIASGRGLLALDNIFAGLMDRIAVIAENGGLVRYQGQTLYDQPMTREEYLEVAELLLTNPHAKGKRFLISGKIGAYMPIGADPDYVTHASRYYDNVQLLDDLTAIDDTIYKLTTEFGKEHLEAAVADFNARSEVFLAVPTGPGGVDIIRKGLDKSIGLNILCQHLNLPTSATTAFGDNLNDVELLSLAGRAVAMENGRAEVKALADEVIGHHVTGAVLTYLEQTVADIKLLALDLDGTLFTSDKHITKANREALLLAQEKGIDIVITTGRPLKSIEGLLSELHLQGSDHYSVTFNGGLVQRNDGQILAQTSLTLAEVATIQQVLEPLGLPVDVISDGVVYSIPSQGVTSLYQQANPHLTFVQLTSLADLPRELTYNKIVTVCEPDYLDERIARLPQSLKDQFEVVKSREIILEVMPKGVHKAAGLTQLTNHLGISSHQVMTVGDEENDLTMLTWAGWGVAMVNAVPAAKSAARLTLTRTNDQSGVAEVIHRYLLKKEM